MDKSSASSYNRVRQELFIAETMADIPTVHEPVTGQKLSEILENLDTMNHGLSPLKDLVVQTENIELLAEQAANAGDDVCSA